MSWRPGIIYAYSCLDHATGKRERWAYVGKTRQLLINRHDQHMKIQPWSDLYPEVRVVWQFSSCPDWWLHLAEKWTIKFTKPLYNYDFNLKNRRRITKYQAAAQRQTRNALRAAARRGRVR